MAEYASHLPYYIEYACKVMQISDYEANQMTQEAFQFVEADLDYDDQ